MADNDLRDFAGSLIDHLPPEHKKAVMSGFHREVKEGEGLTDRPVTLWFARLFISMDSVKKFFKRFV